MKSIILGIAIVIGLTIGSGAMQGKLSNRWGHSDELRKAGAKLESLPKVFGDWDMVKSETMDQYALDQLQPAGYIQRLYVNRMSGAAVMVTVMVGQCGPISVHTPEVCYGSRDNQQQGVRQAVEIPRSAGGSDAVWKTTFRLKGIDAQVMNIYYGWTAGDRWAAAENPRFSYAAEPKLYKIQLASRLPAWLDDKTADPGVQFLTDFFPVLHEYLQNPSAR
jgi:hypothetical protein